MVKKWQFVSNQVEDGAGKDDKTRKIVRKAAMKAFRRNQRMERTKEFLQNNGDRHELQTLDKMIEERVSEAFEDSEEAGTLVLHQGTDIEGPPMDVCSSIVLPKPQGWDEGAAPSCFRWPQEIASLDPFGSSPLGACSTWHFLFTHFVYAIAPMIQPLGINSHLNPVNTQWAHHAMSDAALFHGVLFHASVHVELFQGKTWSQTTLFHRGEIIRLVSEQLNSPDGLASDEIIAAVAWVASEGNITGDVEGDRIHWNAISKMLKIRGGLESLGWNGALELLLTLGNIIFSMVAGTPPTIEPPILTNADFPDIPPSLIHNTGAILTVQEFGEDTMRLLRFMSELTIAQSKLIHTPRVRAEEIISFNRLRSAVEHRLLSIRISSPPNSLESQLESAVYEACRIAALMCGNCVFREFTPQAVSIKRLKADLHLALSEIETLSDQEAVRDFEELILWVYFIGGMLSTSTGMEWFSDRVATSMSNLGLEDWIEVEQCLARCFWMEKMRNQYCLAFWEKVRRSTL